MKYKKTYIVELQAEKKKFHITMDFLQDEKIDIAFLFDCLLKFESRIS